jgi:3-dehydroquinate synthase
MRTVQVLLGNRSYSIHIGQGMLSQLSDECVRLKLSRRCAVISDRNVARFYGKTTVNALCKAGFDPAVITVPAGEKAKSLRVVERCYDQLAAHRIERRSFIVALGGGVVGDLAGFVAASYLRGITFVQVPTSLLAQVDSSVGGKVGVNLAAGKNLVGAFYQPRVVLCDLETLRTLPPREFRAGLAEVIKYAIIYDENLFLRLERDLSKLIRQHGQTLSEVVARCCEIKAEVVAQDETEGGLRAILNFGHTIGHALEAICGYGTLLHGEAISIGQVAAARISSEVLGLPPGQVRRITRLFEKAGLPTSIRLTSKQRSRMFDTMKLDKKVSAGEVTFVLAKKIGTVEWGRKVPIDVIERAMGS